MERVILSSEIAGVDLRGAILRGVGAQGFVGIRVTINGKK